MSDPIFYITVLHGANEGATVDFNKDSFSIGSDDECDIILSGLPSEEKRLIISQEGKKFFIKAINKSFYLDATEVHVADDFILLKPYQIVDIDGCRLTLCKEGEELPDNIKQKKFFKVLQESHDERMVAAFRNLKPKPPEKNYITPKAVLVSLFSLMMVGGIFFITSKPATETKIESFSADFGVEESKVEKQLLASRQTQQLDLDANKTIENDLDTTKSAIEQAYQLLRAYEVNRIDLHLDDTGLLTAKGYVGNEKNWEKAKTSIVGDIDAIKDINVAGVETLESRSAALNILLQDNDLKQNLLVDINQSKNTIKVSGEVTHNDLMQWEQVKAIFLQESGSEEPIIEEEITDIDKNINLSIRSVSVGKVAFFVSEAGEKYLVGSDLGNGYLVSAIEKDKIILQYKGKKVSIFYNQLMESGTKNNSIRS